MTLKAMTENHSSSHILHFSPGIWSWECDKREGLCVKMLADSSSPMVELQTCRLTCGPYSTLFPRPSGYTRFGTETVPFMPSNVKLKTLYCDTSRCSGKMLNFDRYQIVDSHRTYHWISGNQRKMRPISLSSLSGQMQLSQIKSNQIKSNRKVFFLNSFPIIHTITS